MEMKNIRDEIIELISSRMGIEQQRLYNYGKEKSLLDVDIGLQPRDLVTLFFELQKKYEVAFEEKDIIERRFDFLDNIVDAIAEKRITV